MVMLLHLQRAELEVVVQEDVTIQMVEMAASTLGAAAVEVAVFYVAVPGFHTPVMAGLALL